MERGLPVCLLALCCLCAVGSPGRAPLPREVRQAVLRWQEAGNPTALEFPASSSRKETVKASIKLTSSPYTYIVDYAVKFHLFTQSTESEITGTTVSLNSEVIESAGWNSSLPTRILIHGFSDSIKCNMIQRIKDAYLSTGDYNVVGVDWSALCVAPLYVYAVANVLPTGERVGEFIDYLVESNLTTSSQIHVVGHSLGAHVAGVAARSLTTGNVSRVTGLDPALPLFPYLPEEYKISKDVAEVVDVIHTSGGKLGYFDPLGDVDFYPNGGCDQPGCGDDIVGVCAHRRSHIYFAESIFDKKGFLSEYCVSEANITAGNCSSSDYAMMGDELQFATTGLYYLETNSTYPFNLDA